MGKRKKDGEHKRIGKNIWAGEKIGVDGCSEKEGVI